MDFKPSGTRVVVLADPELKETEAGTILLVADKVYRGEVMAVGPGKKEEPMEVVVGERVCYTENAGTPLEIDGVSYLLMRQAAIYGKL